MEEKAEQAKQQKQNNNLLLLACTRGYCADAQHLLRSGADVSAHDKKGFTTLHFAAAHGHLDVVTFLWSKGAEIDWETPDGRSPLHLAALKGHSSVVRFLLSKQAWSDSQDAEDSTALHLAARGNSQHTVSELLKVSASTIITNKLGLTPLAEAIVSGQLANARLLLAKDPGGLKHRPQGWSLLHLACATGQTDCAALLIKNGADVQDKEGAFGLTPLHAAGLSGDVACIKTLLAAKASVSAASHDGSLPSDLVPQDCPDRPQLLVLLKSSSAGKRKRKTTPQGANNTSVDSSEVYGPPLVRAFTALTKDQQLSRVERWAQKGPADPQVLAELKGFWSEVEKRLAEAHRTMMVLALHKVLMMLHNDEGYQKDVGDPKAMDAVLTELKQHPDRLPRFTSDPAKQNVFKKIELFQMVLKATEQRGQVPWQETLVPQGTANWKEQDEMRKKRLEVMLETQKEAVVAAALASSEEEAAQQAGIAAAESKQRLVHELQQHSPDTSAFTQNADDNSQGTTAAGPASHTSQPPSPQARTPLAQATKKPALGSKVSTTNAGSALAVSSSESKGGTKVEAAGGVGGSIKAPQHGKKSNTGREGTGAVSAQAGLSAEEEEGLPPSMTFKEAMYHFRFMAAGQAIVLLGLFLWLRYMTNRMQAGGVDQNQNADMLQGEL